MRKLSQKELADLVKLDGCTISLYERGKFKPSASALVELAKALSINTDVLLMEEISQEAKQVLHDKDMLYFFTLVDKFPKKDKETIKNLLYSMAVKNRLA
jgi:transcriptional regulator with XRE-family HTH domain